MRLSVVTFLRPGTEPRDRPLGRIVDYARRIEKRGFPGIWVTDSLGRGRPTLDPLVALGVLSAATERVELGTAVLQVSLRNPIELAHRCSRCRRCRAAACGSASAADRRKPISISSALITNSAFAP